MESFKTFVLSSHQVNEILQLITSKVLQLYQDHHRFQTDDAVSGTHKIDASPHQEPPSRIFLRLQMAHAEFCGNYEFTPGKETTPSPSSP